MKLTILPDHIAPRSFWQFYLGDYVPDIHSVPPVCRVHASEELDDLISDVLDREGKVEIDLDASLIAALNERENERKSERENERVSPEKVSETVIAVDIETTGQYNTETLKSGDFDWNKTLFGDAPCSPMNWIHWGDTLRQVTNYADALGISMEEWPLAPAPKDKSFRWRLRKGRVVG